MKKTFLIAGASLYACIQPLRLQASPYIWDNENANGIWNDSANWGINNNPGYNHEPTAGDVAIFRSSSPAGTVVLTNNSFADRIRQNVSAPARTITIAPNQTVDRVFTMTGTNINLIECVAATANFSFDGTPNGNGARLKLAINGTQPDCPVNGGVSLMLNCDVSGTNGLALSAGNSGAGMMVLGGFNSYTGPTTVNAGTMLVNGSTAAASAVTVNSGGTLGGNGTLGGPVRVNSGGTLSPGASVGTLNCGGSLTLAGNLYIEVDKSLSSSNDVVAVAGLLTNAGVGNITVQNVGAASLAPGDSFKIFNKPVLNGQALHLVFSGSEVWTNKLAVDGSIAVLPTTNPPPAPAALAATSVTSNSFTANWNSSSGATGYRLDVSTNSLFSSFASGYQDLDAGNVLNWNVSGLSGSLTNYYRVRAYNTNGTSGNSATITVPPPTSSSSGDPTQAYTWNCTSDTDQNWSSAANWVGNQAPQSSSIIVFQGDVLVPWNWPNINTNYGTTILIFSNNIVLNGIKITAGMNHTMNLGSYVLQDQPPNAQSPCYFGIDSDIDFGWQQRGGGHIYTHNANFTNALGDASCGSQTEFKCVGGRLDVYGVLRDGAGTSSKLIKSGERTLAITGTKGNLYTGGTVVNAGPIKMGKYTPGNNSIPGDVTVNGTGGLIMNNSGGEQIADTGIVTLNNSGYFDLGGQPETVQTIQSTSASTSISSVNSTLTVAPSSGGNYNGGTGESDFAGSISGTGTVRMNGTGIYGMLGANSVANLTVNSGTLKLSGNSGTGAVTVNTGGTLLGNGTLAGAVSVANGGTIGAGFSAGLLTLAAGLDLSASGTGATNVWELAALNDNGTGVAGTDFDQIVLTGGTLVLGAQATLDIRFIGSATAPAASNPFWQSAHTWTIISLNGGVNPGFSNFGRVKNGSYTAGNFTTAPDGNGGIVLTFTPGSSRPPVTITSIVGAGTTNVTVNWTNTVVGTNYTLRYNTNLNPADWSDVGTVTASGVSASLVDHPAAGDPERYYQVKHLSE